MVKKKDKAADKSQHENAEDDEAIPFDEVLRRVLSVPKPAKKPQNAGNVDKTEKNR